MPSVKEIASKVKSVTKTAPPEVKEAAEAFLDSISDFSQNLPMSLSVANQIWNEDLPEKFKGKFDLR